MRIGVRLRPSAVGGALVSGSRVLAAATVSLRSLWHEPLAGLLCGLADVAPSPVESVTWDVSAVLKAALLGAGRPEGNGAGAGAALPPARPVAAVRVAPKPPSVPGIGLHPSPLVRSLIAWRSSVTGGHDLFGRELAPLDLDAARHCAATAQQAGLGTLAITATGAAALSEHEARCAAELLEHFPRLRLCLSHEFGGLGLLEREAATVLNAALLDTAEDLVARCEKATAELGPQVSCWFTTGDGGRVPARRLRWAPVAGVASTEAAAMIGAAGLAGSMDALVVLTGPGTVTIGQVRDGLPHVEPDLPGTLGVRMAAPQPLLTVNTVESAPIAAALLSQHSRRTTDVVAELDQGGLEIAEQIAGSAGGMPLLVRPEADICAVGAALTEPGTWLDLLVPVDGPEELRKVQSRAEQQALAVVAANGAQPGTERIIRSTATAVGYLHNPLYRLQIRAGSRPGSEGVR